jgi:enoyl-CoA hydratase/carnithine racemase
MSSIRELAGGKILAEVDGPIGVLTFNQPEKRNAISVEMWGGVAQALDEWAKDANIRVVVLTGAGDKAFVSGGDISQYEKLRSDAEAQAEYSRMTAPGRNKLINFPKPVIAQIRGFALGGGLAIAMMSDFRISSETGIFGIPAARLSIAYAFDSLRTLISLVGPAKAKMILYTAERMNAGEALRIGLVDEVVADDKLEARVRELAMIMANNAPLSVAYSKFAIGQALRDPADRDMATIERLFDECFSSADYAEGRRAFMEKRPPKFVGK